MSPYSDQLLEEILKTLQEIKEGMVGRETDIPPIPYTPVGPTLFNSPICVQCGISYEQMTGYVCVNQRCPQATFTQS